MATPEAPAEAEEEAPEPAEPPPRYACACHYCRDDDAHDLPGLGTPAPPFHALAVTPDGLADIEAAAYRGRWLVLLAFPTMAAHITPSEIVAFSENYRRFADANCDVLGLTLENAYTVLAWTEQPRATGGIGPVNFAIAGDVAHCISLRYGIVGDGGADLNRATFIIDPEGTVKFIEVAVPEATRSVEETLRLVKAFRFVEESGDVCPAQWKEGEPAIKPSVVESKNYFGQRY